MVQNYINRLAWMAGLVLLQVLVFNHISLLGYATPFVYVYLMLKLGSETSRNGLMVWGFVLGLLVDVFSDTPGMNASATVLMAFARPVLLRLFAPRDMTDALVPAVHSMGLSSFLKYVIVCVLLHHLVLLTLLYFSLAHPGRLALHTLGSSVLTVACLMALETMQQSKK